MSTAPSLLNDDGTASVATAAMMAHLALRRDLARFTAALATLITDDTARSEALREEWQSFHANLDMHHTVEDKVVFPNLLRAKESLKATLDQLEAEHRRIDPLLERGDAAFAELSEAALAAAVIEELSALLEPHFVLEETELIPILRNVKTFPPLSTEEEIEVYARGMAWSSHGVAADVIEQLDVLLAESVRAKLPAARQAFADRFERVWGSRDAGAARTAVPES